MSSSNLESKSLGEILKLMKPKNLWGILVIVLGLVTGSFLFGQWISDQLYEFETSRLVEQHTDAISSLKAEIQNKQQEIDILNEKIETVESNEIDQSQAMAYFTFKAYFLDRYSRYLISKDEISEKQLTSHVCALSKEADARELAFIRGNLEYLHHNAYFLRENRQKANNFFYQYRIDVNKLIHGDSHYYDKQLNKIKVIKKVVFPDGDNYLIPEEISMIVHSPDGCLPR